MVHSSTNKMCSFYFPSVFCPSLLSFLLLFPTWNISHRGKESEIIWRNGTIPTTLPLLSLLFLTCCCTAAATAACLCCSATRLAACCTTACCCWLFIWKGYNMSTTKWNLINEFIPMRLSVSHCTFSLLLSFIIIHIHSLWCIYDQM